MFSDAFESSDNLPYEQIGDNEPVCIADEVPFEIPESWEWVRLSTINEMYTGNSINDTEKKLHYTDITEGYYYIATKDISFESKIDYDNGIRIPYGLDKFKIAPRDSILLCIEGGSAGRKIAFTEQEVCFGNKLCCFISYGIDYKFLYYYIQSPLFQSIFKSNKTGIIGGVSVNTLKNMYMPVPPLKEQSRIVKKIKELEPDVLDYTITEENLNKLNRSFPNKFKKSILQEAVMGKLVPQDPNDEPASVLLERIRKEKQRLVAEGKIKKDKNESIIFKRDNSHYEKLNGIERCIDDEIPFEIPDSWRWVRLWDVVSKEIKRGKSPKYSSVSSVFVFAQKCNVKNGGINISLSKYLDLEHFKKYAETEYMLDGDIVVNSTGEGTLGRIGIFSDSDRINNNVIVPDSHVTIVRSSKQLNNSYIYYTMKYYQNYLEKLGGGSTNQTELKPLIIAQLFIPIPPLEEQQRIVDKLESLLSTVKLL